MSLTIAMLSIHTSPLAQPGQTKDAGGMNVYIRELALELARQQVSIDIFTRRESPLVPQVVYLAPNVRVIHIDAGPALPVHKNDLYQYTPTFARHIDEFKREEQRHYDLIHSHYWLSGLAAMRLACHWNVPHVTMFHTLGQLKQLAHPDASEPPLRLEMEQRLIHHVDRIIAATNDERVQIERYCGVAANRVEVMPCGVDLRLFVHHEREQARVRLGFSPHLPVLLYVGRLDPFKGPDMLLQALSLMQEPAQVVIVGGQQGDAEMQYLQDVAQYLGIADRVAFWGSRPREQMPLIYSAANLTVVPSYHESFGLAAVESLACGTPVVATRAGGLTTVIRHGESGFLVPRVLSFFAARLDLLLRDHALYTSFCQAARASVIRFGWSHVADQVIGLYEELTYNELSLLA